MMRIAIGFVLSFLIGAGCRYFDIPAASPPVIPGALIVLAMTLGYSSMDRIVSRKERVATTKHLCGGPTGLPKESLMREASNGCTQVVVYGTAAAWSERPESRDISCGSHFL
jgi:XapX domain-containing protein